MSMPTMWPVSDINAEFTGPASTAIAVGDLLYWASTVVQPFSSLADAGTEALQQTGAARLFIGVSNTQRLSTDAAAGNVRVLVDGIYDFPCESNTFAIGDYVGPSYNTNVLRNQTVDKVALPHMAIGRVVKRYSSATTKVKCRIMSRYLLGMRDRFGDIGGIGQGLARTATTASGNITLTVNSNPSQVIDPNSADRTVTLPAVASSNGMKFYVNHAGTANIIIINNPAASAIGALAPGESAYCWCDDTGWKVILGAARASASETAPAKGMYVSGTVSVAVPSITDPDIAKVDVDTSAMTFAAAVGDAVVAIPLEALPTNARLQGAWVNATDQVQITFGSEGGNVVGASKNFKFLFIDLT